MTRRTEFTASI